MDRLRGICVGAGYFSQFHFDAWQRIPAAQIVAVCDTDYAKARAATDILPAAEPYVDVCEALDRHRPDFLDIITPPASHRTLVSEAARRGVAIICQKPLAPDFATAGEIVAIAARHQVPLMVHENFRFQPWHRAIKQLLTAGAIGDRLHSLYFRSRLGDGWGPDAYLARQPYFRDMPRLLVHETGVHFIDTFRYLAGEIDETYAILHQWNAVIRGEDAGLLTFRFANGAVGVWDASRYNEPNVGDPRYTFGEFLVEGNGGSLRLYGDGRLTLQPLGAAEQEHAYAHERRGFGGDCVFFAQQHFIERLTTRQPFETNGADYLKTLAVVEAVYASAATRQPVRPAVAPTLAAPAPRQVQFPTASNRPRRLVDLSLPIDNNLRGVSITPCTTLADRGWNSTTLSLYSHCGTHMDAPKHFLGDHAATIDQQALDACCGPARVINLTPVESRELITVERFLERCDTVQAGDRLLIRTDWHQRHGTAEYRDALPRISLDLAHWLVQRKVALVGVEPPSVADVHDLEELTAVHQTLFRGGIVIVEGLANLDQLRASIVDFVALPLRVVAGDGSPVRAIAFEPNDE